MKLLLAAASLVVATFGLAAAAGPVHYVVMPGMDAPFKDIKNGMTKNIAQLEAMCTALPACMGFNSNGWLKSNVTSPSKAACDLYVKTAGPAPPAQAQIWPLPAAYTNGSTTVTVSPKLAFAGPSTASPTLTAAYARYAGIMFAHATTSVPDGSLATVNVAVTTVSEAPPQLETDESYTLDVPADGSAATLTANTIYGALRGLETLSQLVVFDFDTETYVLRNAPWSVKDAPRFRHRGMLIDTARHFQPVASIKRVIEAAAFTKFNVIHWHIVDLQSFPFQSMTYPKLWEGAWAPQERYTQADVKEVVEFGRMRGVRIMVEFDVPGHAAAWCTGYPEICPSPTCQMPLNVASNKTFELIEGLITEVSGSAPGAGLFPYEFVHLGGDEVNTACWESTPAVAAWLKANNLTTTQAYMYFVERAAHIAFNHSRQVVQWVEVFDNFGSKLDNRTVVHVWKAKSTLTAVLAAGYRALLSDSDLWYLDHLSITWQQMYMNEPLADVPDPKQGQLLLGGEAEMWGETVDESDIESTIWPRAAAVAERLWSPRSVNDVGQALPRLQRFRCLLNFRGIGAAPVDNSQARESPPGPGDCYLQ